ncbi:MAG: hypothetical protein IPM58_11855 [Nitrospira sp.]|nr:hypothetical protein [Nitrospira sp.]
MMHPTLFLMIGLVGLGLSATPVHAAAVTQLDLTGGAVNFGGQHHEMMDRLLGQDGTLKLGQYQAIGEIVPSIGKSCETFSIFTSGFHSAPAPTATISGSSISVDLSSLFFGTSRGSFHQTWNIGSQATGLFNQDSREFTVSWNHVFDGDNQAGPATFFLKGIVAFAVDSQPVPIPAGVVLYATGLFGVGSWSWWRRRASLTAAA